ncbi:4-(cytidine 5'-diphospho)-2-C-methyl-D-erythritol kinase [Oecophyllibacter saccharovorans]|uniref:4-(cytidine 5'-diphospho)-2-C-methyl-D-erythritol kinase n=1 Tax=Oecophyllibacter saccharovorans TaxID=2558360 RepID=UPI0038B31406
MDPETPTSPLPSPSTPPRMERACAKINLYLHVTGRRADGYHLLDSLAVFTDACDRLFLETLPPPEASGPRNIPSDQPPFTLHLDGQFGRKLLNEGKAVAGNDNLILKAARFLAEAAGQTGELPDNLAPIAFRLEKDLPVASGIGGGSADAAAALRLLTACWDLKPELQVQVGPLLGADVPVCLLQRPARMEGIGEQLSAAPALPPAMGMLLVNPGVAVATPAIFKALAAGGGPAARAPLVLPSQGWQSVEELAGWLQTHTTNDLEGPAIAQAPVIQDVLTILRQLPEIRLARMSGSGATCFALLESPQAAQRARTALASHPQAASWWHWAGGMTSLPHKTGPQA